MDTTKLAVAIFDKLADLYQEKYMAVDLYHDSLDLFCDRLPIDAHILELACGPGNITQYLLKKRPDLRILGIDLAPNMLALAKLNNPTAEFKLMDCRDIHQLDQQYAAIMAGFCLPYLSKEEAVQLISHAAALLKPEGILYLSTMEGDYSQSGFQSASTGDQMYMHYHQADYLTVALQEIGFKILEIRHQPYPTQDGSKVTDLIIIATC